MIHFYLVVILAILVKAQMISLEHFDKNVGEVWTTSITYSLGLGDKMSVTCISDRHIINSKKKKFFNKMYYFTCMHYMPTNGKPIRIQASS